MATKRPKSPVGASLADTLTPENAELLFQGRRTWAELLAVTPAMGAAIGAVGRYYYERGEYYRAKEILETLTQINPRDAHAKGSYGAACHALREYDLALESYNDALRADPTLAAARLNRAELLWHRGEFDKAQEDLALVAQADEPQFSEVKARAQLLLTMLPG